MSVGDGMDSASGGRGWLDKADDDLRVASVILASQIGVEWAACFHAQQSAEKALKGLLVHLAIDFPKTHSLERLVALMPAEPRARFDLEALIELTPWAVAGRYPEDIENPTPTQARSLIDAAAHIVAEARTAIEED